MEHGQVVRIQTAVRTEPKMSVMKVSRLTANLKRNCRSC